MPAERKAESGFWSGDQAVAPAVGSAIGQAISSVVPSQRGIVLYGDVPVRCERSLGPLDICRSV
jgi:hypothetical protein